MIAIAMLFHCNAPIDSDAAVLLVTPPLIAEHRLDNLGMRLIILHIAPLNPK